MLGNQLLNNVLFLLLSSRCSCPEGYTSKNCDLNVNDCEYHLCRNGAACEDDLNSYRCICPRGFAGKMFWTGWSRARLPLPYIHVS